MTEANSAVLLAVSAHELQVSGITAVCTALKRIHLSITLRFCLFLCVVLVSLRCAHLIVLGKYTD